MYLTVYYKFRVNTNITSKLKECIYKLMFKNSLHVQKLPPWLSFMFCASFKLGKYDIHI